MENKVKTPIAKRESKIPHMGDHKFSQYVQIVAPMSKLDGVAPLTLTLPLLTPTLCTVGCFAKIKFFSLGKPAYLPGPAKPS